MIDSVQENVRVCCFPIITKKNNWVVSSITFETSVEDEDEKFKKKLI